MMEGEEGEEGGFQSVWRWFNHIRPRCLAHFVPQQQTVSGFTSADFGTTDPFLLFILNQR